jgi:hypothetical protein
MTLESPGKFELVVMHLHLLRLLCKSACIFAVGFLQSLGVAAC